MIPPLNLADDFQGCRDLRWAYKKPLNHTTTVGQVLDLSKNRIWYGCEGCPYSTMW
jgi:hypothetical protein